MTFLFNFATYPSGFSGLRLPQRCRPPPAVATCPGLPPSLLSNPGLAEYMVSNCATIMQSYPAEAPGHFWALPDGRGPADPPAAGKTMLPLLTLQPRLWGTRPDTVERVLDDAQEVLVG